MWVWRWLDLCRPAALRCHNLGSSCPLKCLDIPTPDVVLSLGAALTCAPHTRTLRKPRQGFNTVAICDQHCPDMRPGLGSGDSFLLSSMWREQWTCLPFWHPLDSIALCSGRSPSPYTLGCVETLVWLRRWDCPGYGLGGARGDAGRATRRVGHRPNSSLTLRHHLGAHGHDRAQASNPVPQTGARLAKANRRAVIGAAAARRVRHPEDPLPFRSMTGRTR